MASTNACLSWAVFDGFPDRARGVFGGSRAAAADAAPAAVPVTTAIVVKKEMPLEVGVIGTVEAHATVAVRAQITGALTAVNFREGEDVKANQVIFELDRRPLEAALHQAEANLQRDTAQSRTPT